MREAAHGGVLSKLVPKWGAYRLAAGTGFPLFTLSILKLSSTSGAASLPASAPAIAVDLWSNLNHELNVNQDEGYRGTPIADDALPQE